jgi:hypothetical protein
MIRFALLLLLTSVASASIDLVRRPFILRDATAEDCEFVSHALGSAVGRHGLKDRTFLAPDHRIFSMFESPGRVIARRDGDRIIVSFDFDARDRVVCNSVHRHVGKALLERFGSRMEEPVSNPKEPNQSSQRNAIVQPASAFESRSSRG